MKNIIYNKRNKCKKVYKVIIKDYVKSIETSFDDVDVLETSYPTKLNGGNIVISFNFFNINNYFITKRKEGFIFTKTFYKLEVLETFYTVDFIPTIKKTVIESEKEELLNLIIKDIEKLSLEAKQINFNFSKKPNQASILNVRIFKALQEIISNTEKTLFRFPVEDNIYKKILIYKIEAFEDSNELIAFFRTQFNLFDFIDIEDIYVDAKSASYKELVIVFNHNIPFFTDI